MKKQARKEKKILVLEDLRSMENVGSIFRTADAVGIEKIYLTGTTPTPYDKFNRPQNKLLKASLGAEKSIDWEKVEDAASVLSALKKEGFYIIAIEQTKDSVLYSKVKPREKTVFVLGSEVEGVSEKSLALADIVAEIPMRGEKESLNVSVAAGIALYGILR